MIELGKTLRTAREAKGLTVGQLAEITKIAPSVIDHLENENFSDIAAPIYGRGFVKLYCEAVGLEAKPLVAEYMDIVSGAHEPVIHERAPVAEPAAPEPAADPIPEPAREPVPEPLPQPPPEETHKVEPESDDLFSPRPPAEPVETPAVTADAFPPPPPAAAEDKTPSFSRYAAPIRHNQLASPLAAYRRLAILAIGTIAVLALIVWGVSALYRTLSTAPGENLPAPAEQPAAQPTEKAPPASATPAAPTERKVQKVSDLYID